jgi:hypothetical protein
VGGPVEVLVKEMVTGGVHTAAWVLVKEEDTPGVTII